MGTRGKSRRRPCWPPGTGSSPTTAAASARQAGPSIGYDFDTIAGDLHVLLSTLDLHGVALAGFAMGTGEVTRHLAVHGSGRVRAAVLVAPRLPFLLNHR